MKIGESLTDWSLSFTCRINDCDGWSARAVGGRDERRSGTSLAVDLMDMFSKSTITSFMVPVPEIGKDGVANSPECAVRLTLAKLGFMFGRYIRTLENVDLVKHIPENQKNTQGNSTEYSLLVGLGPLKKREKFLWRLAAMEGSELSSGLVGACSYFEWALG